MSHAPKYIIGTLVELGTPEGDTQPRALIHCTEEEISAVRHVPILGRVAIVPLEQLHGSAVPPIVAECASLRERVAQLESALALGQVNCDAAYADLRAERDAALQELGALRASRGGDA